MAGWFAAAVPLGGFGREARGGRAGAAALAAAKCWAVGVPVRRHSRIMSVHTIPCTTLQECAQDAWGCMCSRLVWAGALIAECWCLNGLSAEY